MGEKRVRLWGDDRHAAYWRDVGEAEQVATAKKYGEYTARDLDARWAALEDDERALLELLVLSERRAVVALYEDPLCNALVEKELLQIPAGVGTLLMQHLETTFKVPRAVWSELCARKEDFVPCTEPEARERLAEVVGRVGHHLRE